VKKSDQSDYIDWDAGREGYVETKAKFVPVVTIPKEIPKDPGQGGLLSVRAEQRLGCLIAAAGAIWAVHVMTIDFNNLWQMPVLPAGPCEVSAVGILMWLHAKWRRSIKV
jgi:hypothetical protein